MTKNFYLVRHAQYDNPLKILAGRLPVTLSEVGIGQAKKLSEFFFDKKIELIYSSPVKRCQQTSEIIANTVIPIEYDVRLAETFSPYQGYWELDWSHFYGHHEELGGESPQDISLRMMDFWQSIVKKDEKNCIICSHGDPLYLLFAQLTGLTIPSIKEITSILGDEYQPTGSVRKIVMEGDDVRAENVVTFTETAY